jgi:hypothetical protein
MYANFGRLVQEKLCKLNIDLVFPHPQEVRNGFVKPDGQRLHTPL